MITAASASQSKASKKYEELSNDLDSDFNSEDDYDDCSINEEEQQDEVDIMKRTWKYLSPPNKEEDLIGKWFTVCLKGKKSESLFISKFVSRFLIDEDGPVECLIMHSLKTKIGPGTILEDNPAHLPPDESRFDLCDVIAGPIDVNPLKGLSKFDVPKYE